MSKEREGKASVGTCESKEKESMQITSQIHTNPPLERSEPNEGGKQEFASIYS